jgi:disulfide bond formation protein DsbB
MDAITTTATRGSPKRAAMRPRWQFAAVVLILAGATIAGAFAFQAAGYAPCELCLKERWPYYAGLLVAVPTLGCGLLGWTKAARVGLTFLALIFLFSAVFGAYHAGVEWGFWPGPSDCTGTPARAKNAAEFLTQLRTTRVVRCDAVAIRILGLSLAGWNALLSASMAAVALFGAARRGPLRP